MSDVIFNELPSHSQYRVMIRCGIIIKSCRPFSFSSVDHGVMVKRAKMSVFCLPFSLIISRLMDGWPDGCYKRAERTPAGSSLILRWWMVADHTAEDVERTHVSNRFSFILRSLSPRRPATRPRVQFSISRMSALKTVTTSSPYF